MQHPLQLQLQHHVLLGVADLVALAVCLTESEVLAEVLVALLPAQLQHQRFKLQHLLLLTFQQLLAADAEHLQATPVAAVVADLTFVEK